MRVVETELGRRGRLRTYFVGTDNRRALWIVRREKASGDAFSLTSALECCGHSFSK